LNEEWRISDANKDVKLTDYVNGSMIDSPEGRASLLIMETLEKTEEGTRFTLQIQGNRNLTSHSAIGFIAIDTYLFTSLFCLMVQSN